MLDESKTWDMNCKVIAELFERFTICSIL